MGVLRPTGFLLLARIAVKPGSGPNYVKVLRILSAFIHMFHGHRAARVSPRVVQLVILPPFDRAISYRNSVSRVEYGGSGPISARNNEKYLRK